MVDTHCLKTTKTILNMPVNKLTLVNNIKITSLYNIIFLRLYSHNGVQIRVYFYDRSFICYQIVGLSLRSFYFWRKNHDLSENSVDKQCQCDQCGFHVFKNERSHSESIIRYTRFSVKTPQRLANLIFAAASGELSSSSELSPEASLESSSAPSSASSSSEFSETTSSNLECLSYRFTRIRKVVETLKQFGFGTGILFWNQIFVIRILDYNFC